MQKLILTTIVISAYPSISFAYIDPGMLSILTQGLYALVAGFFMTYIFAPWHKVTAFARRVLGKSEEKSGAKKKQGKVGKKK